MNGKKYFPIIVFLIFLGLIINATLYFSPSWGLMDDCQNLEHIKKIWEPRFSLFSLGDIIISDYNSFGVFRPVYFIWVAFAYHFFKESPVSIYILIVILNMITALIWGLILHGLFSKREEDKWVDIFIFPLSFFIFTPFWNIFMYISLQEKFIYFFSALALYFFKMGYDKSKRYLIFIAVSLLILGILTKPTGIHLVAAFIIFAFLDIIFLNYKRSISYFVFILNFILFFFYYYFSLASIRGYTSRYGANLHLNSLINNLLTSSAVVKLLVIFALLAFIYMFTKVLFKKNKFSPLGILIPLGLLCYILIFLPWGFPNYLLSAASPYILGIFFPVYIFINKKSKIINLLNNALLILIVTATFIFIIAPRISKMSDVKIVENFIKEFNTKNPNSVYFYPPPFYESAIALRYFTNVKIVYFGNNTLSKDMLQDCDCNYLMFRNEGITSTISLKDIKIENEIYRNKTWRIMRLVRKDGNSEEFNLNFPQNLFERIKSLLRDLK